MSDELRVTGALAPVRPASALVSGMPEVLYGAMAGIAPNGTGRSREVTLWRGALADAVAYTPLDGPCQHAAMAYTNTIGLITLGMVRGQPPVTRPDQAPVLVFRGLRLRMLQFGALEQVEPGHYRYPVMGGLLSRGLLTTHSAPNGYLGFKWWREGRDERFETYVEEFRPTLMGRQGRLVGRLIYGTTQMNAHRYVMWRYHVWVQRKRELLLAGQALPTLQAPRAALPAADEDAL